MNYPEAQATLNGRNSKKLKNNTYLKQLEGQAIGLRLHETDVIVFKPRYAELYSGGWLTLTTKARLNEFGPAYISQKNHVWYMPDGSLFYEGIKVDYNGRVIKPRAADKAEAKNKKLKADIKKYVDGFVKHIDAGKLENPGPGDCWYCLMFEPAGQGSPDHIRDHLTEKYYVPSLLINAIKAAGYNSPGVIWDMVQRGDHWATRKILTGYLFKKLSGRKLAERSTGYAGQ